MKRPTLVLAALLVFCTALLVQMPASLVARLLRPDTAAWALEDVRGSVWQGSVTRTYWRGRELGALAWRVRPAALLLGRIDADVNVRGELEAAARVRRGLLRTEVRNLRVELPTSWLGEEGVGLSLRPQGRLRVTVPLLAFEGDRPVALRGDAVWRDAAVAGATAATFGELRASFALTADRRVRGTVRDGGGALSVAGGFVVDGSRYRVDLLLAARDPRVAPALRWIGRPQADGRYRLALEGAVPGAAASARGRHR